MTRPLPSRLRRLDGALADLPLDEPMLLSELDGFLTGILLSPQPIAPAEWMTVVWGADGDVPPFDDPIDVQWFADAVAARLDEIARDAARGKVRPLFERGEGWEPWVAGFDAAMALRDDAWEQWAASDDDAAAAIARLTLLIAVACDESDLDSVAINALHDTAPDDVVDAVRRLHAARAAIAGPPAVAAAPEAKVGRNDPCRCGSGRKSKHCCG